MVPPASAQKNSVEANPVLQLVKGVDRAYCAVSRRLQACS